MATDVVENFPQVANMVRLTDLVGVKCNAEDAATLITLGIQPVKCGLAGIYKIASAIGSAVPKRRIVQVVGVGHRDQLSPRHDDGNRHVVVHPVSVIQHAGLGYERWRAFGVGDRRCQDAFEVLTGMTFKRINIVPIKSPFLHFVHAIQKSRVVDAMAHDTPLALTDQCRNIREMVQKGEVEGYGGANWVVLQHLVHSPQAHAVAVIPKTIFPHVRVRGHPVPGFAADGGRRGVLVKLNIGNNPHGQAFASRPLDGRPAAHRRITDKVANGFHARAIVFSKELCSVEDR